MEYRLPFGVLRHARVHRSEERRILEPSAEARDEARTPVTRHIQPLLNVRIVHLAQELRGGSRLQLRGSVFGQWIAKRDRHLLDKFGRRPWLRNDVRALLAHEKLVGRGVLAGARG